MEEKLAMTQGLVKELEGPLAAKKDGLSSPFPKLQKGVSWESAAIDTESEFVKEMDPKPCFQTVDLSGFLEKGGL